jgi:hypothetical protein
MIFETVSGELRDAAALGVELGRRLLGRGAAEILKQLDGLT